MSRLPKNPDPFDLRGCYIAGGTILSLATKSDINDYDVYPKNAEGFSNAIDKLLDSGCFVVKVSDRAITFKCNTEKNSKGERAIIQVMTYDYFDTAEKIFDNFDFTVCMGAFDCDTSSYTLHQDFYPDIATKTLRFNHKTKYPLNSLLRVSKYNHKGFFMSKPEYVKMALAIAKEGMPSSWEELEDQIGGSYGREIRLSRDGLEYSFENMIMVLSDMAFDFENYINAEDKEYDKLSADDIINFYDKTKKVRFFEIEQKEDYLNVRKKLRYTLDENNCVLGEMDDRLIKEFGMPTHFVDVSTERLCAFIILKDNEQSILRTNDYKSPDYAIGHETIFSTNLQKTQITANRNATIQKSRVFVASFNAYDVVRVYGDIVNVSKVKVDTEVVTPTDNK